MTSSTGAAAEGFRFSRIVEEFGADPWNEEEAAHNNEALERSLALWEAQDRLYEQLRRDWTPLERAKAYAAKEPPAISGQRGHDRTYHVACVLWNDFALDEPECLEAIQDWNRTCKPPWSEKELRHKIKSAAQAKHDKPRGWRLNDENGHAGSNGKVRRNAGPLAPPKEVAFEDVATIADLEQAGAQVRWMWEGWIPIGVLTALAAEGGRGKTRFCADLLRRIRHGLPWPDGQTMTATPDVRSLWVLSDNHHDEMVTLTTAFGIKEAVWINASKADPYGGVTLDGPEDLAALEARIKAVKPLLVIVDTVGNATDLNLSRQEEAKAFYQPLQLIARRNRCAILCLTHLNTDGRFLGRRVLEKVRVAIRMDQPNDGDERRRVEVTKSNSKKPAALGLTMGDQGNEYDTSPPKAAEAPGGEPSGRLKEVCEWLSSRLKAGECKVAAVRTEAEMEGISSKTLYAAKKALGVDEFESEGRKWWRLKEDAEAV